MYISPSMTNAFTIAVIAILLVLRPGNTIAKVHDTVQRAAIIKGVVLNEKKKPMPGAVVTVYKDGKSIANNTTDKDGKISCWINEMNVIASDYQIQIAYLGYTKHSVILASIDTILKFKVQMIKGPKAPEGITIIKDACFRRKRQEKLPTTNKELPPPTPLLDPLEPTKRIITSEEIEKMAR